MSPPTTIIYDWIATPLGKALMATSDAGLAGFWFHDQKHLPTGLDAWKRDAHSRLLRQTKEQISAYFVGELAQFTVPTAPQGTLFQQRVWAELVNIPFGETRTYGGLALALGDANLARAVGAATGRNPISVVIPCHRLVGASGALTGYAGGLERKKQLLALEKAGCFSCDSEVKCFCAKSESRKSTKKQAF